MTIMQIVKKEVKLNKSQISHFAEGAGLIVIDLKNALELTHCNLFNVIGHCTAAILLVGPIRLPGFPSNKQLTDSSPSVGRSYTHTHTHNLSSVGGKKQPWFYAPFDSMITRA